jgi:hypothetical protein
MALGLILGFFQNPKIVFGLFFGFFQKPKNCAWFNFWGFEKTPKLRLPAFLVFVKNQKCNYLIYRFYFYFF